MTLCRTAIGLAVAALLFGQPAMAKAAPPSDETATAAAIEAARTSPPRLRALLQAMPKGGDLHNHLWGAVYAEDFIDWAGQDGLCVSRTALAITPGPCEGKDLLPARDIATGDPALYSMLVDKLSTRDHFRGLGTNDRSGHDRFFDSFRRFAPIAQRSLGRMIAKAADNAGADGLFYVETMSNPLQTEEAAAITASRGSDGNDFPALYAALEPRLPALIAKARAELDGAEAEARDIGKCGTVQAAPACAVTLRYQAFALRTLPPAQVFGQIAFAFALASADPRYVGVNIVAPEDAPRALADYALHMRMFAFLKDKYPSVKLSLHAGELTLGLVPPPALQDHIRQAVEIAGASRIGHGVDIAYERDTASLLTRMARDKVAVEINLSSNDVILGVAAAEHPLGLYRAAGVPVVLSTDDPGVARSDMTNEYMRAVVRQGLGYADLKHMTRASITYSFLPGASLWSDAARGDMATPCRASGPQPSPSCTAFLAGSEKAAMEWRLEQALRAYERRIAAEARQ